MLISDAHRVMYMQYYATQATRRLRRHAWQSVIEQLIADVGAQSVLDYGCGPGAHLSAFLSVECQNYDPGVPAFAAEPVRADIVVCNHALEHVEATCLPAVLAHLWELTRLAAYIAVSCQVSTKRLPDGTAWHASVHPAMWWQGQMKQCPGASLCAEQMSETLYICTLVRKESPHG